MTASRVKVEGGRVRARAKGLVKPGHQAVLLTPITAQGRVNNLMNYILALLPLLILFGAINTIQLKLQNIQIVDQQSGSKFFHPFMQSICMFTGEVLVGLLYLAQWLRHRNKATAEAVVTAKPLAPEWLVIFPAVMDLLSTLLSYTALNLVDSSVWQISRGGNIITTALLSICFLKRVFSRGALVGCFLAFLGITSVQVVAVLYSDSSASENLQNQLIGMVLLVLSIIFNSMGLITEKWIFNKYEMSPLKMVFLEGLYGLVVLIPLTFAFQYVSCPWSNTKVCVQVDGQFYLENISQFWTQLQDNSFLMVLNAGLILSIAISVPMAVTVSKLISPVSRSLADVCRTVFIWLFGIIATLTLGKDRKEYENMEDTRVVVNVLKGLGFLVLILGTLMYHDLVPLFRKHEEEEQSLLQAQPQLQSEGSFGREGTA